MRYKSTPKFTFRDPGGSEWRIRRALSFKSPWRPRWKVEQLRDARWVMRATAETRKMAHERMESLWEREARARERAT